MSMMYAFTFVNYGNLAIAVDGNPVNDNIAILFKMLYGKNGTSEIGLTYARNNLVGGNISTVLFFVPYITSRKRCTVSQCGRLHYIRLLSAAYSVEGLRDL